MFVVLFFKSERERGKEREREREKKRERERDRERECVLLHTSVYSFFSC
jgi:hypothetical protein